MCGYAAYYNENEDTYRCVPYVSSEYISDLWGEQSVMWDAAQDEMLDDAYYYGILVATADTAFIIEENTKADTTLTWAGNRYYGKMVPTLPAFYYEADKDWEAAVELARADFNGNLNTAKIQAFCASAKAAEYCTDEQANHLAQRFLPSAGQLYLMYLNKAAINALIEAANEEGCEYDALDNDWYWSSSQYDEFCAWGVLVYGGGTNYDKYDSNYVRAVSAFHFIY